MARMVLVHGAAHGGWCWRDLVPQLERLGHEVVALDLPSHGNDPTPVEDVDFERYVAAITDALVEPSLLLGHSMGGIPVTQAAERCPAMVRRLVYLCAFLPRDGDSSAAILRRQARNPLRPAVHRVPGLPAFAFDPEQAPALFYHDCPAETAAYALPRLSPQPIAPTEAPVRLSGALDGLPRSYILCTADRAIPPEAQREMASVLPDADVHARAWGHSPFFSDPEGLARLLDSLA